MHELSITQGIIELCLNYAKGRKVHALEVEIGTLSNIVPEAVEFCFDACSSGTLLEGASLQIIRTQGQGNCLDCGKDTAMAELFSPCCHCGGNRVRIVAGEELRLREIEVADP